MSIDWCKNCDRCVEGDTEWSDKHDAQTCKTCGDPVTMYPEDNPTKDR